MPIPTLLISALVLAPLILLVVDLVGRQPERAPAPPVGDRRP